MAHCSSPTDLRLVSRLGRHTPGPTARGITDETAEIGVRAPDSWLALETLRRGVPVLAEGDRSELHPPDTKKRGSRYVGCPGRTEKLDCVGDFVTDVPIRRSGTFPISIFDTSAPTESMIVLPIPPAI